MKNLLKILIILVLLAGVVGVGTYLGLLSKLNPQKPVNNVASDKLFGWKFPVAKFPLTGLNDNLIAYSSIRDPGGIAQGLPVRLKIPVIGVDSAIEDALITPDGRMDVPAGSVNVAWFSLGPHPGQEGSAVIGGHFGINNGVPFVFYNLDKVKIGDKVYILDDKNDTLAFQVRLIKSFDRNADSTTVFTSQDGKAHLNLITCEGTWNQVNGSYPLRLVIFTDAIPAEGAVVVKKQPPIAAKPILPQTAVTTAPIISAGPTATPTTIQAPTALPTLIPSSIKNLYATPIDGLVTSVLLASIILIAFTIIRR